MQCSWANIVEADELADAERYYAAGKFDQAKVILDAVIKREPSKASPHYLMGNIFFAKRVYPYAIAEYSNAIRAEPLSQAAKYSGLILSKLKAHAASNANVFQPPLDFWASTYKTKGFVLFVPPEGSTALPPPGSKELPGNVWLVSGHYLGQSAGAAAEDDDAPAPVTLFEQYNAQVNVILKQRDDKLRAIDDYTEKERVALLKQPTLSQAQKESLLDSYYQDNCIRRWSVLNQVVIRCSEIQAFYHAQEVDARKVNAGNILKK